MAQLIQTANKPQAIYLTTREIIAYRDKFVSCDLCGADVEYGYYIPLIDVFYCEICFKAYINGAQDITPPEREIQRKNADKIIDFLKSCGTWEKDDE